MSNMIKWTNRSGSEVETNDSADTVKAAEAAGWKREGSTKAKGKPDPKAKAADEDSE